MRKEHEDSHYCLALARNCKIAVFKAKLLADDDRRPSAVKAAHGDDKCKIPYGPAEAETAEVLQTAETAQGAAGSRDVELL